MSLNIADQITYIEMWLAEAEPIDLADDHYRYTLEEIIKSLRWLQELITQSDGSDVRGGDSS